MPKESSSSKIAADPQGEGKCRPEVDGTYVLSMLDTLSICASAMEFNGPAGFMLAQELADIGKPLEALTLGELIVAMDRVEVRYNGMMECSQKKL